MLRTLGLIALLAAAPARAQFAPAGGGGGGSTTPGGVNGNNQINSGGTLGADSNSYVTASSETFSGSGGVGVINQLTVGGTLTTNVTGGGTQCLQVNNAGAVSGTTCGGSPGTPTNSVQYNNGGSLGGDSLFFVQASSVGVYQPIQLSSNTTIGFDVGHCGALLNIGTTGTRCGTQGNNFTNDSVLIHNNGGLVVALTDQSDTNENDIGIDNTGAWVGPIQGGVVMAVRVAATPVIRLGTGGGHNVTIGALVQNDAGTNAPLYINNPSTAAVGGTIFSNVSSTNTIGNTNEIVLYTNVIAAGMFKNTGDCIRLLCGGHGAANTNTKRLRIRFNNTTSSSVDGSILDDTGAQAANNTMLAAMAYVCKTGSSTQVLAYTEAQGAGVLGGAITNPSLTATDTSAINVACTCQNGTANSGDCVGNAFKGKYEPAP